MRLGIAPSAEICERAMHVIFACLGVHKSYLDVECDHGFLVRAARMFGCKPSIGQTLVRGVKAEAKAFATIRVVEASALIPEFDLITCFRVIPADVARLLAPRGHVIVGGPFTNEKGPQVNGLRLADTKTVALQHSWCQADLRPLPEEVQVFIRA